ncbi:MAG: hypothetical protein R3336_05610, partial [Phycisphaeraceae bacterium]|nr:hypothetical protein [Phycisphaeraceae bacterium]
MIILGLVTVLVVIVILLVWHDRRRTEAFRKMAEPMGLSFTEKDKNVHDRAPFSHWPLCQTGDGRHARHMLAGKVGELDLWIFDYVYTVGSGSGK